MFPQLESVSKNQGAHELGKLFLIFIHFFWNVEFPSGKAVTLCTSTPMPVRGINGQHPAAYWTGTLVLGEFHMASARCCPQVSGAHMGTGSSLGPSL